MESYNEITDVESLEAIVSQSDFKTAEDVESFFIAYTKLIWEHRMIGRIYDHYSDDIVIHGENGKDLSGIEPVIAHTSERLFSMPDIKINFVGIWAKQLNDSEYTFIQITQPQGTFTGPSLYGPPTHKKVESGKIINMCECLVKKINGTWKIVEEWGLLGYADFFSEGKKNEILV